MCFLVLAFACSGLDVFCLLSIVCVCVVFFVICDSMCIIVCASMRLSGIIWFVC